jgi:hypothetical protein
MRSNFTRFYTDKFRIDKLLEIFDYMACVSAYAYSFANPSEPPCTFVTVCMDQLFAEHRISIQNDLILTAYPTFVGSSTAEIRLDIDSVIDGQEVNCASTFFLMAARQVKDYQKSFKLPKLQFEGENDVERSELRAEIGRRSQIRRKNFDVNSVFRVPPTSEEGQHLFNLFRQIKNNEVTLLRACFNLAS